MKNEKIVVLAFVLLAALQSSGQYVPINESNLETIFVSTIISIKKSLFSGTAYKVKAQSKSGFLLDQKLIAN